MTTRVAPKAIKVRQFVEFYKLFSCKRHLTELQLNKLVFNLASQTQYIDMNHFVSNRSHHKFSERSLPKEQQNPNPSGSPGICAIYQYNCPNNGKGLTIGIKEADTI